MDLCAISHSKTLKKAVRDKLLRYKEHSQQRAQGFIRIVDKIEKILEKPVDEE
jgi:hypothetical protein